MGVGRTDPASASRPDPLASWGVRREAVTLERQKGTLMRLRPAARANTTAYEARRLR